LLATEPPWAPRSLQIAFSYQGHIWVLGGQTLPSIAHKSPIDENFSKEIWKSVDGISWSRVIPQDPYFSPRGGIGGSVFELNEKIFVVGGFNYEGEVLDERRIWGDVWSGAEGLTSWQMLGSIPNPLSYSSVAVWDERIWIVGGYTPLGGNSNEISFSDDGANWSTLSCSPIMPTHAATIWATPKGLIIGPGNEFQSAIWIIEKDDD